MPDVPFVTLLLLWFTVRTMCSICIRATPHAIWWDANFVFRTCSSLGLLRISAMFQLDGNSLFYIREILLLDVYCWRKLERSTNFLYPSSVVYFTTAGKVFTGSFMSNILIYFLAFFILVEIGFKPNHISTSQRSTAISCLIIYSVLVSQET